MIGFKTRFILAVCGLLVFASLLFVGVAYKDRSETLKAIEKERIERAHQLNRFLRVQCARDQVRDAALAQILREQKHHVAGDVADPFERTAQLAALDSAIRLLQFVGRNCVTSIPSVTGGD